MEILSYSLADLIPFSRETYFRLFERYNVAVWPAPIVGLALGMMSAFAMRRPGHRGLRAAILIMAFCWLWIGGVFMMRWYFPLTWVGAYFAVGFGLQGVLMAILLRGRELIRQPEATSWEWRIALSMVFFALFIQPLLGFFAMRAWYSLEVFGSAPDPTVVATLGLLLIIRHPLRWLLAIIPLTWCVLSGATLFVLSAPVWPVMLLAGALYLGTALRQWSSARRSERR